MYLRGCLLFVLLAGLAAFAAAKERTWTSSDGRTMRAEFVRELDGEVTFLVAGKLTTIPLDRLSERDQQIARDLAAGKEVPDDPPEPPTPVPDDPFSSPPARSDDAPAAAAELEPAESTRPPSLTKRAIPPTNRVWTDNQGRKTTAKFIRVFNGHVVLSRAGGPISIPFFDLVEADQQYVKDVLTSRDEEALIPERPLAPAAGTGELASGAGPGTTTTPMSPSPAGYSPPAVSTDSGTPTTPMGYGAGGYGPGGYGSSIAGSSNPFAEQERQASAAANAAMRQANQDMQAQEDRMNQMMRSSSPLYQPSTSVTERVPVCSACRATLTEAETHGKRCPRCGAWWAYDTYHGNGSSSGADGSAGSGVQFDFLKDPQSKRAVYSGIGVVVVLAVLAAVIIGVIAVALAIASASRSGRQYKEVG